jgi:dihydroflavonol-4-reductase
MITLVTGATGFVGGHVARLLVLRGERVRVMVRPGSSLRALQGLSVERCEGDLRDSASIERALAGVSKVFHVAADYRLWARNPKEIYDSNVGGTRNLLHASARCAIERFVYTSTVATIAVHRPGELPDENTDALLEEMIGDYKRSKYLAEQEALQAAARGLPVVIVNPTTPVGPGDWKPTPTGRIVVDFLNGRMPAYVDTGLNVVGVEDAAAGHLLAAERGRIGERYILGGRNMALKEILDALGRLTGLPGPTMQVPHALAMLAAHADEMWAKIRGREPQIPVDGVRMARHRMFVDGSKAERELGYAPGAVEQALGRAVRWYQENGYVRKGRLARMAPVAA